MTKKTYERLIMDVTEFDIEDVITTSDVEPVVSDHQTTMGRFEQGIGMPVTL